MHPESKHAFSAFCYVVAFIVAPFAFFIGILTGGTEGYTACLLSLLSLSTGYVLTSLPKAPVTNREAAIEILFWFLTSSSFVLVLVTVMSKSWVAFSILLTLSGLALLIWQKSTEKTKRRIQRAPLI